MNATQLQTGSSHRPIPLRSRPDLVISRSLFQGEQSWIVKDPLALKYFRIREPEYEILRLLNGKTSFSEVKWHLAQRFPAKKFEVRQIQQLVESFHRSGLLHSSAVGQAEPLGKRRRKERKQKATSLLSSIIAIRFPGVDPDRFLSWLHPMIAWAFSKTALLFGLVLVTAALLLVGTNLDEFAARLPKFQQFFAVDNLLVMGLLLILTKSIHELGHGLACKNFGGECHEIGFMLMVLTPAMYCNTSDSWTLPNKWHRIAIGAAGMWVEVLMASAATFIWWYTHPGWLHYLCLNIMFLSSVATIVFNINPLLRYDGYYMLSDYLEIPNLSQKANRALINRLRTWCLGMQPLAQSYLPEQRQLVFAIYSVASFFYRWFVMVMIFWFLSGVFEPYGLAVIGYVAVGLALFGAVVAPLWKLVNYFCYPGRLREVKIVRLATTLVAMAGIGWGACYVPLPHHVTCDFVVRPIDAQSLFVSWPGTVQSVHVKHGDRVREGQLIAELENTDLDLAILELQREEQQLRAALEHYRVATQSPLKSARLAGETRAKLTQVRKQLDDRQHQRERLQLRSDRDGFVMPPPNLPEAVEGDGQLQQWTGLPLDPENVSAKLQRETLVCYVGDPKQMQAVAVVAQSDLRFLLPEQPVVLMVRAWRGRRLSGVVQAVSNAPLTELPRELSATNGGPIAVDGQREGMETSMLTLYEAGIRIDPTDEALLLPGMTGKAKIKVGAAPIATRVLRQLASVFKFR